jgi:hypothetical protein
MGELQVTIWLAASMANQARSNGNPSTGQATMLVLNVANATIKSRVGGEAWMAGPLQTVSVDPL